MPTLSFSPDRICCRAALSKLLPRSISSSALALLARLKAALASADSNRRGRPQLVRDRNPLHQVATELLRWREMKQQPESTMQVHPSKMTRLATNVKSGPQAEKTVFFKQFKIKVKKILKCKN